MKIKIPLKKTFMLGRLRNSCTINSVTKNWIDHRWNWLTDQFGQDVMLKSPTVLPSRDFFPDAYDRSEDSVQTLVNRVCQYMNVSPHLINLEFYSNTNPLRLVNENGDVIPTAAGTYHQGDSHCVVSLDRSQFDTPMSLVGTVAHELAHVRMLSEKRLPRDSFDNELLTDLTVVFHGLGIFRANVRRHWQSHVSVWPGTDVPMPRYMTTPMYGYALALRCRLRNEPPKWQRCLSPGVRAEFKQAMRYLQRQP